jgi:hypothetical protein
LATCGEAIAAVPIIKIQVHTLVVALGVPLPTGKLANSSAVAELSLQTPNAAIPAVLSVPIGFYTYSTTVGEFHLTGKIA